MMFDRQIERDTVIPEVLTANEIEAIQDGLELLYAKGELYRPEVMSIGQKMGWADWANHIKREHQL